MNRKVWILVSCLLLTACVKQEVVNRTALPLAGGLDRASDNQMELTYVLPMFKAGDPGAVSDVVISRKGHARETMIERMQMQLNRPIYQSKTSLFLFGKEMASSGLGDELDVVLRDARSTRKMYWCVVDGTAKELLHGDFDSDTGKGMFLQTLLEHNAKYGFLPERYIHHFEYSLLGQGIDPFLPLLRYADGKVDLIGLALFKDDKYVASLNVKQMSVMKLLLEKTKNGSLDVKLAQGQYVTVQNLGSNALYRLTKDKDGTGVSIVLKMKAAVTDMQSEEYSADATEIIGAALEEDLERTANEMLRMFQKEGIDPLGLGDFARSKTRGWREDSWNTAYPEAKLNMNAEVELSEKGIRK